LNLFKLIFRFFFSLYGFLIFMVIMLLFFPFIVIFSFFGRMRGGNLIYSLCRIWADVWMVMIGIWHKKIYEQPLDKSKPCIFISNHISYLDIPIMMQSTKGQHIRILGKSEMAKVPIFGFIYRKAVVLVHRSDPKDRAESIRVLKSVIKKGVSVFVCPEGTFNMTGAPLKEFYDGAFRVAIETQMPIRPLLLLDTFDRLNYHSIFSLNPGRSRTVFLEEVSTTGLNRADIGVLREKVYDIMQQALIKYKATWINAG